jgi:hypothetical protein
MKRAPFSVTLTTDGRGCVVEHGTVAERPAERAVIRLAPTLLKDIRIEARRRGVSQDELAAAIIRMVSSEALYDAVLGRVGEPVQRRSARRPGYTPAAK